MTSGYTPGSMPEKDQPGFDQILRALREGLNEMPAEEVARQLVQGGHLEREPPPPLVAEALEGLEAEEQSLQNEELSSEDGNPTGAVHWRSSPARRNTSSLSTTRCCDGP